MKNMQATEKTANEEYVEKVKTLKMPVYHCHCGGNLLIVPDLTAMFKAIERHIGHHNRITGDHITEDKLSNEILKTVWKLSEQQQTKNAYSMHASI